MTGNERKEERKRQVILVFKEKFLQKGMIHLAVNIKQIKGSNNLIQQAKFVQDNLNGKISFSDNNLVLSVPLKTVSSDGEDLPVTEDNSFITKKYVDSSIESIKGTASENADTLGKLEAAIKDINAITAGVQSVTATANYDEGTTIGTITVDDSTVTFKIDLSSYAPLDSPDLTGTPTAPTPAKGNITKQIATTAFVTTAISDIKGTPATGLNTLEKISTALGDDSLFAVNVNSSLDNKQPLSSALSSIASLTTVADKMIYTTGSNTYAVTSLTQAARNLLDDVDAETMRNTLDVPKKDGTGATGTWNITAATATNAENDSAGNPISTTYLKVKDHQDPDLTPYALKSDIKDVSVTNTTDTGVRIGTITVGNKATDLNVSFAGYAPLGSPALTGSPTAPTVTDQDDDSTKIATTAFVAGSIRRLVGTTPEELNTLQELAAALNNEPNFASSLASVVSGKQDKSDALTSISELTTSANKMIYTTAQDVYATTDLSNFVVTDNVLGSNNAATFRSRIGALGSSEKAVSATTADSATTAATATNATNAVNDSEGKQISTTYVKISSLHNLESTTHLGWTSAAADSVKAVSVNALKNWNGRYNSTVSSLAYCNQGAFGNIVTHSSSDFLTKTDADTYYKDINYEPDLSGYLTTTAAAGTYLSKNAKAASATTADSATTAGSCTGNAATATVLKTAQTINIANSDGTSPTSGVSFDGSKDVTLKLPATIKADITGTATAALSAGSAINDGAGNEIAATYLKESDLSGYAKTSTINSLLHLISHYTVCSTTASTVAKTVTISAISSYTLATGNRVTVKFVNTNTAANPTLSVNGTTAKAIHYRGSAIPAAALQADSTYDFVYNGIAWEIVGSVIWAE